MGENVWTTEILVREHPRITYTHIEKIVGISSGSIHTILHQHLGVSRLCCQWIPRLLSESEKQTPFDWCHEMRLYFENQLERRPKNGLRGIILHHDNASSHTFLRTKAFIEESGVETLSHPPYSPDLAPFDFFLFPRVKEKIKGKFFSSAEEAVAAYEEAISDLSDQDWQKCFQSWLSRMELCIEYDGEYFENMSNKY